MTKIKKVGGGSWGVYRPEPEPHNWLWWVIGAFVVLALLGQCAQ